MKDCTTLQSKRFFQLLILNWRNPEGRILHWSVIDKRELRLNIKHVIDLTSGEKMSKICLRTERRHQIHLITRKTAPCMLPANYQKNKNFTKLLPSWLIHFWLRFKPPTPTKRSESACYLCDQFHETINYCKKYSRPAKVLRFDLLSRGYCAKKLPRFLVKNLQ